MHILVGRPTVVVARSIYGWMDENDMTATRSSSSSLDLKTSLSKMSIRASHDHELMSFAEPAGF